MKEKSTFSFSRCSFMVLSVLSSTASHLFTAMMLYWNFTYTPEATGAYVFSVRAVTEEGLVTVEPEEMMINVQ